MNIDNLKLVRDDIARAGPNHFDMTRWVDNMGCQTVACIAGFAAVRHQNLSVTETPVLDIRKSCSNSTVMGLAEEFLGIDGDQSHDLFLSDSINEWPTFEEALDHLDNIIALGEFRYWSQTLPQHSNEEEDDERI